MINKLQLTSFVFFNLVIVSVLAQNLLSCDTTSSLDYVCGGNKSQQKCKTFALLRANPRYSSLSNLSSYLGISRSGLAEANDFSGNTEILSAEQPILIPIDCECGSGGIFGAQVRKTTVAGESFYEISESLEGLTTCKAIQEKNPSIPPWNLRERISLLVPLKCACPATDDLSKFLLSYPVREGDKLSDLAVKFNASQENIVSANSRYSRTGLFKPDNSLLPLSTLLIPLQAKPVLGLSAKSQEPNLGYPAASIKVRGSHKRRKPKMWMIGVYIAIGMVGLLACLAIGAAFFFIHCKRKKEDPIKNGDSELQQLSLSIRTTSDKKVSFEGSQYNFDDPITATTTPHKMRDENYTFEELQKATEDFSLSNLIEGSVFHGRLKGKTLAIKRVPSDVISKIDYEILQERIHRHPNTIRLLGTCLTDSPDSYIVLEYAKNGSLKDWIHSGLAIKSQFIASCNCFLTWNQRVKICLDVATALQYMHHIMNPSYVHRNIKSRNIFLDEDFSAKVGNFGMANCSGQEAEDQESYQAAWNKGYLAPEYLSEGIISPSMDVFAYGVVLLEVLSGKPPTTRDDDKEDGSLIRLSDEIKQILQSEDAEELREWIDGALGENYSFDGAVMLANLARSCVEDDPCSRPNAGEIVEKLLRLVEELGEGEELNVCESSCKPLVKAAAIEM
ncbi:protein LYK2 [Sesamum angolense]|uniref:Protein LYK2 n=1 Tax=Sesamum angolense TaxID=2727404 RepID=A0AAE2C5M1_9LAMI|nr:protein LYK2 [Sesamum angolense]